MCSSTPMRRIHCPAMRRRRRCGSRLAPWGGGNSAAPFASSTLQLQPCHLPADLPAAATPLLLSMCPLQEDPNQNTIPVGLLRLLGGPTGQDLTVAQLHLLSSLRQLALQLCTNRPGAVFLLWVTKLPSTEDCSALHLSMSCRVVTSPRVASPLSLSTHLALQASRDMRYLDKWTIAGAYLHRNSLQPRVARCCAQLLHVVHAPSSSWLFFLN